MHTSARQPRPGPETDLLNGFLAAFEVPVPKHCRLTLFREPRLESGFPDAVYVKWSVATAKRWNHHRLDLTKRDFQVLQLLVHCRSSASLPSVGLTDQMLQESLERLDAAKMVTRIRGQWELRPLRFLFAVRDIIAIEAKMREWSDVLHQARLNTWFASQSYVLVSRPPTGARFLDTAREAGLGLINALAPLAPMVDALQFGLPRSYASWLFNESVCRSLHEA